MKKINDATISKAAYKLELSDIEIPSLMFMDEGSIALKLERVEENSPIKRERMRSGVN